MNNLLNTIQAESSVHYRNDNLKDDPDTCFEDHLWRVKETLVGKFL